MAKMRIITESELHRGDVIGSGAFGTVYKVLTRFNSCLSWISWSI